MVQREQYMDSHKAAVSAYEPYFKEALFCLWLDIIIALIISVFLIMTKVTFLLWIIPIFFVFELFVNFRIAVLAIFERRKSRYATKNVYITDLHIEDSASGHWGSILPRLYPSNLQIERYRLTCTGSDGEKIMLRCAMSTAKRKILNKFLGKNCMLKVTYGRMSKIVVKYDGAESDMYRLNQRV